MVAAVAAPAFTAFVVPTAGAPTQIACAGGEEEDQFTTVCVPHTVPNSPFTAIPGNPDLPSIDGIPCTGRNSGECIGLSEDAPPEMGPPESTVDTAPPSPDKAGQADSCDPVA